MNRHNLVLFPILAGLAIASLHSEPASAASCAVSASAISFGSYDPLSHSSNDSSTNIQVTCSLSPPPSTETVTYSLSLSVGTGSYAARTMLRGTSSIIYNLYANASRDSSSVWGDGTGGSTTVAGTLLPLTTSNTVRTANHTLYGRIPARQDIRIGVYNANVTLTMTF